MSWNLSSGFVKKLEIQRAKLKERVVANTIAFGDSYIADSNSGLGNFRVGDWILVNSATNGGVNDNIIARVISASDAQLDFAAGTFTAQAEGSTYIISTFDSGCIADILKNGRLDLYSGNRPSSADDAEAGTLLVQITLNGNPFTPGLPENGLNLQELSGNVLKRAIDPATGDTEMWQGLGLADGTAAWGRWYDNDAITGDSTDAVRLDGVVYTTTGGDIIMTNGRDVAVNAPVTVTDVNITVLGV